MTNNLILGKPKTAKAFNLRTSLRKKYLAVALGVATIMPIATSAEVIAATNVYPVAPDSTGLITDSTGNCALQPVSDTSLFPAQLAKRVLHLLLQTIARDA
ncbi:hypothetical protein WG947_07675 [Pontibacter sp. H259]|uniref:hypothetical protein n=1 Tax=Pontibacter sp. H259 TaxID=3133421 RepID=UPI0030BAE84A